MTDIQKDVIILVLGSIVSIFLVFLAFGIDYAIAHEYLPTHDFLKQWIISTQ